MQHTRRVPAINKTSYAGRITQLLRTAIGAVPLPEERAPPPEKKAVKPVFEPGDLEDKLAYVATATPVIESIMEDMLSSLYRADNSKWKCRRKLESARLDSQAESLRQWGYEFQDIYQEIVHVVGDRVDTSKHPNLQRNLPTLLVVADQIGRKTIPGQDNIDIFKDQGLRVGYSYKGITINGNWMQIRGEIENLETEANRVLSEYRNELRSGQ